MMRFLLIFFGFFGFFSFAQVEFSTTKHDFGTLEPYSLRYVDVILKNTGNKQAWILTVKKPMDVVYITSKQIMEPDSSVVVRLQVNPKVKGRFSYDVDIFTSDQNEPTRIKLTGALRELGQNDMSAFTDCPDFSERPGGKNPNEFDLTVVTIDKETRKEVSKSTVTMIQNGQSLWAKRTDGNGKIKAPSSLGLSYFYATHHDYFPAELGAYVNFKRNYIVIELERNPVIGQPVPVPIDTTVIVETVPEEISIEEHLEEQLQPDLDSSLLAELPPSFSEIDKENFDSEFFKPVNVVFVLDVSSSMRHADKVELMKYALFQLTDMLREEDRMGIVTYASETRVLLKPTSGALKPEIKEKVTELEAFGYTAGGAGIKLGFKQANKAKLEEGVNHVIVITDGAFNRDSKGYEKQIKKYKRKGIQMSIVGIKNKEVDEEKMREAARLGGGQYIPIFKLTDARNNLKQQIRALSYRH